MVRTLSEIGQWQRRAAATVAADIMTGYTETWFDTFLSPSTAAPVERELEFVRKHLPVDRFPCLLDVACGIGRHAVPLASLGYDVLGIDISEAALDIARKSSLAGARFQCLDMYDLDTMHQTFDAVLCLWASFGYGTADENQRLLGAMARRVRSGGRVLLDVYQRDAVAALPPHDTAERGSRIVSTTRRLENDRYRVEISYSDTADSDTFEWQVYTQSALCAAGAAAGLGEFLTCAWFDESCRPSVGNVRMQVLFERP